MTVMKPNNSLRYRQLFNDSSILGSKITDNTARVTVVNYLLAIFTEFIFLKYMLGMRKADCCLFGLLWSFEITSRAILEVGTDNTAVIYAKGNPL
jgi:hypothetical protein